MISLTNVHFAYSAKASVFEGLDLALHKGNIYGLLGKNGAGKTTLLKIMLGLVRPSIGQMNVADYNLANEKHRLMLNTSMYLRILSFLLAHSRSLLSAMPRSILILTWRSSLDYSMSLS